MMAERQLTNSSAMPESLNKLFAHANAYALARARGQITGFKTAGEKKAQTGSPV